MKKSILTTIITLGVGVMLFSSVYADNVTVSETMVQNGPDAGCMFVVYDSGTPDGSISYRVLDMSKQRTVKTSGIISNGYEPSVTTYGNYIVVAYVDNKGNLGMITLDPSHNYSLSAPFQYDKGYMPQITTNGGYIYEVHQAQNITNSGICFDKIDLVTSKLLINKNIGLGGTPSIFCDGNDAFNVFYNSSGYLLEQSMYVGSKDKTPQPPVEVVATNILNFAINNQFILSMSNDGRENLSLYYSRVGKYLYKAECPTFQTMGSNLCLVDYNKCLYDLYFSDNQSLDFIPIGNEDLSSINASLTMIPPGVTNAGCMFIIYDSSVSDTMRYQVLDASTGIIVKIGTLGVGGEASVTTFGKNIIVAYSSGDGKLNIIKIDPSNNYSVSAVFQYDKGYMPNIKPLNDSCIYEVHQAQDNSNSDKWFDEIDLTDNTVLLNVDLSQLL